MTLDEAKEAVKANNNIQVALIDYHLDNDVLGVT